MTALAQLYGLVPSVMNSGRKQVILLVKTEWSQVPDDGDLAATLERLTANSATARVPRAKEERARPGRDRAGSAPAGAPRVGGVVGSGAPELDEQNIGNRMLRGMGWAPGTGLGTAAQANLAKRLAGDGSGLMSGTDEAVMCAVVWVGGHTGENQVRQGRAFSCQSRQPSGTGDVALGPEDEGHEAG